MFGTWRRPIDVGWAVGHPNGRCEARPSRPLFDEKILWICEFYPAMLHMLVFPAFKTATANRQRREMGRNMIMVMNAVKFLFGVSWGFTNDEVGSQPYAHAIMQDQLEASLGQHLKDSEGPWSKWSIQNLTFQFSRRVMDQRSPSEGLLGYVEGRWK